MKPQAEYGADDDWVCRGNGGAAVVYTTYDPRSTQRKRDNAPKFTGGTCTLLEGKRDGKAFRAALGVYTYTEDLFARIPANERRARLEEASNEVGQVLSLDPEQGRSHERVDVKVRQSDGRVVLEATGYLKADVSAFHLTFYYKRDHNYYKLIDVSRHRIVALDIDANCKPFSEIRERALEIRRWLEASAGSDTTSR